MYFGRNGGGNLGQVPYSTITLEQFEKIRAAAEAAYFANPDPGGEYYNSLMPVPSGGWFNDPSSGTWYRSGGPFQYAWETMPPVVAGQAEQRILSDAEAAAWIARVEASRQPLYGSPLTLPERLDWTEPLTPEEIARIPPPPTEPVMPPYIPPSQLPPEALPPGTRRLPEPIDPRYAPGGDLGPPLDETTVIFDDFPPAPMPGAPTPAGQVNVWPWLIGGVAAFLLLRK